MKIKPITYIICSFFLFFISCSDKKEIHVNCSKLEMYNYIKDFMKQEAEKGDVVTCLVENDSIWIRNKKGRLTEPDNIHSAIKELYLKNKIDDIAYSQDFDFTLFRYDRQPGEKWWYEHSFLLLKEDLQKYPSTYEVLDSNSCFYLISPIEEIQMRKRLNVDVDYNTGELVGTSKEGLTESEKKAETKKQ